MPRIKRKGIVKRRNVPKMDVTVDNKISVEDALEVVMRIYLSEGYRERTMHDYRKFWDEFMRIIDRKYIQDVTADDFRRYITELLKVRELSPVTVNIRLSAMRTMFRRLHNEKFIAENPGARIHKLRTDEQKLFTLTDKQVKRLFSTVDHDSFAGYRDYVAMLVMLKCGLRSNEINSLEVKDIDFDNGVILLPGAKNKNRKTRTVPMTKKVIDHLLQLINETREYFDSAVTFVFTNQFGERMKDDHLRKRMDFYARKAGLKGECRASPHSLRHTFSTNFLKNGGNIRTLQQILGHSDISTTQVYLNYTDDQVIEQYRKVNESDSLDV
ncbi:tyrosine-type recombinase/integrase [Metabacillus sp. Hm71]|uniref:tyrosine-type recombinase/integrase n=1 Tax=Metabacillus sp. Hm71 TaxID=3450743 RepID=UPI003F433155